jgi:hypothetical protein
VTKPITIQQIQSEAWGVLDEAFKNAYKPKYLAVQTRHKVWLVVARSVYSGDEPRLIKGDERIRVCQSQKEAEGFAKLLKEQ